MATYTFCPLCRGGLKKRSVKALAFSCVRCEFQFFPEPKLTVTLVLRDAEGGVLLVERKHEPHAGFWGTPGGFVDPGETAEIAIKREAKEELGISLKNISYLGTEVLRYPWCGVNLHLTEVIFTAIHDPKKKIRPMDDALSAKFFSKKDIPWKKIAFEGHHRTLRKLFSNRLK